VEVILRNLGEQTGLGTARILKMFVDRNSPKKIHPNSWNTYEMLFRDEKYNSAELDRLKKHVLAGSGLIGEY
jgi:hypothetical protein